MNTILQFIKLSRPLNVVITLLAFGVGSYLALNKNFSFFQDPQFWIAAFIMMGITATGYWINDVFDFKIDRINKPSRIIVNAVLSQKKVISVYFGLTVSLLLFSAFVLPWELTLINFIAALMLFVYSTYFKRVSVIGNLLIAALTALVIYFAALMYDRMSMPLIWTMVFAFEITFLREVVKDVEDIRGDLKYKLRTLPIQIGLGATKSFLRIVYFIFIISCWLPAVEEYVRFETLNIGYIITSVILVQAPCVILAHEVKRYTEPKQFKWQSNALKLIIFTGIFSVLLLG